MSPFIHSLFIVVLFYVLWRVLSTVHFYFREYYTFWNIATGPMVTRKKISPKMHMYVYICKTDYLDEISLTELYKFLSTMNDSDVTYEEFCKISLSYTYAVLSRERNDGSLRGVTFMGIGKKIKDNGSPCTLIRLGLGFFEQKYRGGPYMYFVGIYLFLRELIMHPLTPLYVVGKLYSYKGYCVFVHVLRHSYPRYNLETPEFVRQIINSYGLESKSLKENYNTETFVLERVRTRLKEHVSVIDKEALKDPHIKFFVKRNPGWVKGHQLIVVGLVEWFDILRMIWKMLSKAILGRRKT